MVEIQIRGHIFYVRNSFFFPLRSTVRALHFYRVNNSALCFLVDSRRIVPTHAIIGALDSCSWCHLRNENSIHREIRTHDISAINSGIPGDITAPPGRSGRVENTQNSSITANYGVILVCSRFMLLARAILRAQSQHYKVKLMPHRTGM